ncbi:type VI secretion system protein TssA [Paraburkholderia silviterrae]|uniref:Type VI secretion system protein TssA n=1 Tax=Paraburkholderia silviterrae TaxID=2528715 RepID=A0A4R5MAP5_9BURK|nr:type VI secretion system protein TssA [Paraburkholderia silviterrae]TDG23798.1 type VI secretion system protein TssA [Paraburkholderia silviterrae]
MNADQDYPRSDPLIAPESPRAVESTGDCGENLEYDEAFIELERTVAGVGDQQYGDTLIAAVAPDWQRVKQQAEALLQRSKDLRVVAWLTRAWMEFTGLAGYAKGLALVAELLDSRWDDVHPRIEIDDDGQPDPFSRTNALQAFFSLEALGARARAATLLQVRSVDFPLRKVAALLDGSAEHEGGITRQELCVALNAQRASLDIVGRLLTHIEHLRRTVSERLDEAWVPDISAVEKPLLAVSSLLTQSAVPDAAASTHASAIASAQSAKSALSAQSAAAKGAASASPSHSGEVRSREDANLLLEKVCIYLESCEPAHPSSLLIRRAQRLLHMTFYEIIRDMSPEAIPHIDLLAGLGGNA